MGKWIQCVEGVQCQGELLSVDVLKHKEMCDGLRAGQSITPLKELRGTEFALSS